MENDERSQIPEREKRNYVGYEYKEIVADGQLVSLLLDGYENFGWEINDSVPESGIDGRPGRSQKTIIRLKRDRKILNKTELTRLQRNFEACVSEIQTLEKRKTSAAMIWAFVVGTIGTVFMAGSTFAITAQQPYIALCIVFAVPGLLGWILPYFFYKRIQGKETEKVMPLIEAKYDEIYEICEKGNKLL